MLVTEMEKRVVLRFVELVGLAVVLGGFVGAAYGTLQARREQMWAGGRVEQA